MGVAALGMASYAATFMQVKTNDGKIVKFDVEDVTEVDFMTEEIIPQDTTPVIPSDTSSSIHSYVDLGLPSGTLWATYNIGATKPEEFGDYFSWGEVETKESYLTSNYKWGTSKTGFTKYTTASTELTLFPEDDAATVNWGDDWRMATIDDVQELVDNCKIERTELNGVSGMKFSGDNGASIFIPQTGRYDDNGFYNGGIFGFWTSSLLSELDEYAYNVYMWGNVVYYGEKFSYPRFCGFPVRAVRAK